MTRRSRAAFVAAGLGIALLASLVPGLRAGSLAGLSPGLPDLRDYLRSPRLELRRIEYFGLETLSVGELTATLDLQPRVFLVDLEPDAACGRIEKNPRIARCSALRLPPATLLIEIEERHPVARLGRTKRGVALDGVVLPILKGEKSDLARIRGDPASALRLLRIAARSDVKIESIEVLRKDDLVFRPASDDVRVRVGRQLEREVRDWMRIRHSPLVRNHAAREIDLRFRGGVVLRDFHANTRGEDTDGSS